MSRISEAFRGQKAFVAFVTGGDPDLATTENLIPIMAEAGADLIEIGIPFSDPVAEGIVIQKANDRALKAGCTTDKIFDMVLRVRQKSNIPLVFMTYLNPIFTYGKARFFRRCQESGIDGIIVPDLPFEEKEELTEFSEAYGIELISMIAPTSEERIAMIAKEAKGFIYFVSSLGVTGVRSQITTDIGMMVEKIRKVANIPCAVGFGISTPEQAKAIAAYADGVIVGSAIVRLVEQYGAECANPVSEYIKAMKVALRQKEGL